MSVLIKDFSKTHPKEPTENSEFNWTRIVIGNLALVKNSDREYLLAWVNNNNLDDCFFKFRNHPIVDPARGKLDVMLEEYEEIQKNGITEEDKVFLESYESFVEECEQWKENGRWEEIFDLYKVLLQFDVRSLVILSRDAGYNNTDPDDTFVYWLYNRIAETLADVDL
jgi:hypothetical protein